MPDAPNIPVTMTNPGRVGRLLSGVMPANPLTCLTYHHFAAKSEPAVTRLGVTTTPRTFAAHLDMLQNNYNIVDLDAVIAGELPKRALLITIDDSYRSVVDVAAPLLAERRLPAVLFLNPKPIVQPFVPLENVVSICDPKVVSHVLQKVAKQSDLSRETARNTNLLGIQMRERVKHELLNAIDLSETDLHRELDLFLRPQDVTSLSRMGIEIGNHTMSHALCRTLQADERNEEIVQSRDVIADLSGAPVRAFAVPWGDARDLTASVASDVRSSGHKVTFLMHGRSNRKRPAPDVWYRDLVTNSSPTKLALDLSVRTTIRTMLARANPKDFPATST